MPECGKGIPMLQSRQFAVTLDCSWVTCQSLVYVHLAAIFLLNPDMLHQTLRWLPNRALTRYDNAWLCGRRTDLVAQIPWNSIVRWAPIHWYEGGGRILTPTADSANLVWGSQAMPCRHVLHHAASIEHAACHVLPASAVLNVCLSTLNQICCLANIYNGTEFWPRQQILHVLHHAAGMLASCGMPCAAGISQSCQLWTVFASGHCTRYYAWHVLIHQLLSLKSLL